MSAAPKYEDERAPCPRCGKVQEDDAVECQPGFDQTGEATCPGTEIDAEGFTLQPTAAYLAALDRWIDETVAAQEGAE